MSVMPLTLRGRLRAAEAVAAAVPAPVGSLAELPRGAVGVVTGISADLEPAVARRLVDLGFGAGVEVQMVRRAPLADPVVYRVAGYDVALRRAQASCIQVTSA